MNSINCWANFKIALIALATTFTISCGKNDSEMIERGVPLQLAQSRKAEISDVRYTLELNLPSDKDSLIDGTQTVSFNCSAKSDLILDFAGERFWNVLVNGKESKAEWLNEHIIIPSSSLRVGENSVSLAFVSDDRFLNRNEDYLYSLFVPAHARSVFPCFDQPDLKASFSLSLNLPQGWKAVSNTAVLESDGRKTVFGATKPIPTYLFSFAAGKWESQTFASTDGDCASRKREMTVYYREIDPKKLAQLPEIFVEACHALDYMESYTGIELPFEKYDFVIVPNFQFGGMEHPGAILYNENTMFLPENPSQEEREKRIQLISHETSHLWFGDMVTMRWFDDVWTKEVFANFFAAQMAEPLFPQINHELSWLKSYYAPALADDRTQGSTPIRQRLENLADAGLIYGNIIYDKSPIMMRNLVGYMGEAQFQEGLREYLHNYAYGNASWDELIEVLGRHSDKNLQSFSKVWVYQSGMPSVSIQRTGTDVLVSQDGNLLLPQSLSLGLDESDIHLVMGTSELAQKVKNVGEGLIVPNSDGKFYGLVKMNPEELRRLASSVSEITNDTAREAALMILGENFMQGLYPDAKGYIDNLLEELATENNEQIASTVVSQISSAMREIQDNEREGLETDIFDLAQSHPLASVRQQLCRSLISSAVSPSVVEQLYRIWKEESDGNLNPGDYISMSWQLAVRKPGEAAEILSMQRKRLDGSDPDRVFSENKLRQFDFICDAVSPSQEVRDSLFEALLRPENRTVEPWAESALSFLNHFLREESSVKYIRPALEKLQEVKETGDIFFPAAWCRALLSNHRSAKAYQELQGFLQSNPDYPQLLKNKILLNAYNLQRANINDVQ